MSYNVLLLYLGIRDQKASGAPVLHKKSMLEHISINSSHAVNYEITFND